MKEEGEVEEGKRKREERGKKKEREGRDVTGRWEEEKE